MKFGLRTPNLKKSFKAKTTGRAKRTLKHSLIPGYGKKGMGYIKNPKKAVYNKIYQKTTIDGLAPLKKNTSIKGNAGMKTTPKEKVTSGTVPQNNLPTPNITVKDGKAKIGKKYYSKKSILNYRILFIICGWLLIICGCFTLPIGILFTGLGIFFLICSNSYKKIARQCN